MSYPTSSDTPDWHRSPELNQAVWKFHDEYAREPKEEIAAANQLHTVDMQQLQKYLSDRGMCDRLEFAGGAYEGVKVRTKHDGNVEFDIMVVLRADEFKFQVEDTGQPGYANLRAQHVPAEVGQTNQLIRKALDPNNILSPTKVANGFMGELQKRLNEQIKSGDTVAMNHQIVLRHHDPAAQMDLYWPPSDPQSRPQPSDDTTSATGASNDLEPGAAKPPIFYSVDLVATIVVKGESGEKDRYYVAKPDKSGGSGNAWRQSFSLDEKALLRADDANSCRKPVLRALKVICDSEARLKAITSCHLKTALFQVMQRFNDPAEWKNECFGARLMDVLRQLEEDLGKEVMAHFFLPDANLLDDIPNKSCIGHMRHRLRRLINNRALMLKRLQNATYHWLH